MRLTIDEIVDDYPNAKAVKSAEEMVEWLQVFHTHLAERLHNGEDVLDLIPK